MNCERSNRYRIRTVYTIQKPHTYNMMMPSLLCGMLEEGTLEFQVFFSKFSRFVRNVKLKLFLQLSFKEYVYLLVSRRNRDPNDVFEIFDFLLSLQIPHSKISHSFCVTFSIQTQTHTHTNKSTDWTETSDLFCDETILKEKKQLLAKVISLALSLNHTRHPP